MMIDICPVFAGQDQNQDAVLSKGFMVGIPLENITDLIR